VPRAGPDAETGEEPPAGRTVPLNAALARAIPWRIKTVALPAIRVDLARLGRVDVRPAGPPPLDQFRASRRRADAWKPRGSSPGSVVSRSGKFIPVGSAGRAAPIGLDGQLMHVSAQDGLLWRSLPCPIPPARRHRCPCR
jgi:hypothetical protein